MEAHGGGVWVSDIQCVRSVTSGSLQRETAIPEAMSARRASLEGSRSQIIETPFISASHFHCRYGPPVSASQFPARTRQRKSLPTEPFFRRNHFTRAHMSSTSTVCICGEMLAADPHHTTSCVAYTRHDAAITATELRHQAAITAIERRHQAAMTATTTAIELRHQAAMTELRRAVKASFKPASDFVHQLHFSSTSAEIIKDTCVNAWEDARGHRFRRSDRGGVTVLSSDAAYVAVLPNAAWAAADDSASTSPRATDCSCEGSPTHMRLKARYFQAQLVATLLKSVAAGAVADGDFASILSFGPVAVADGDVKTLPLHRTVRVEGESSLRYDLYRSFSGTYGDIWLDEGFVLTPASSSLLPSAWLQLLTFASRGKYRLMIEVKAETDVQPDHVSQATVAAWTYLSEHPTTRLLVVVVARHEMKYGFAQREEAAAGSPGTLAVHWKSQFAYGFRPAQASPGTSTSDAGSPRPPGGPDPESGPASGSMPPGPAPPPGRDGRSGGSTSKRQRGDTATQEQIADAVAGTCRPEVAKGSDAESAAFAEFVTPCVDVWPDASVGRVQRWIDGVAVPRAF